VVSDFTRYVILLSAIEDRATPPDIIRDHIAFLRCLDGEGKLVLCGPFTNQSGGKVIIRASNMEDATDIAKGDPFVRSGIRRFEVRSWQLSCEENNHLGMG